MSRFFYALIYSNLFISVGSAIMCYYTYFTLHVPPNKNYIFFVFSATLASYSFHWLLTANEPAISKRVQWTIKNKWIHLVLLIVGLTGVTSCGMALKAHWLWIAITALVTFLYSAPKIPVKPFNQLYKIAIGKTIFLALVWMHVTVMLPVIISGVFNPPNFEVFAINRFFLLFPICILFDYRDRDQDVKLGIKSMIFTLSEKGIDVVFWCSLWVFFITAIFIGMGYTFIQFIMLMLPGIFLALLYFKAKKIFTDFLYYFILDGLMMLSGILAILFEFWLHLRT